MTSLLFVLPPSVSSVGSTAKSFGIERAAKYAQIDFYVSTWDQRTFSIQNNDFDYVAFLGEPLELSRDSISLVLEAFTRNPTVTVVYGDSSQTPLPDPSPQRLLRQNFLRSLFFVRKEAVASRGGLSSELETSAAVYELVLSQLGEQELFSHIDVPISRLLTPASTQELSQEEITESKHVLSKAWVNRGGADIGEYLGRGSFEVQAKIQDEPLVSIVIPTQAIFSNRDEKQSCLVIDAVESIVSKTDYSNYELVVVFDSEADQQVLSQLKSIAGSKLNLVEWTKPFNFSQKMNFGVLHAKGDYVLLLNDDVEVLSDNWLSSMLALAQLPNAGMVGAMLYYEDDTIQHAGHAYYEGSPTHIGLGAPRDSDGPNHGFKVAREVSGVTAACALMPMSVFKEVGGFTALLPGNFNDVDLCLKVGWKNYDIYWTPDAELYHFESKSRDAHVHYYELDVIEHRWGLRLSDNRFWRGHPWATQ